MSARDAVKRIFVSLTSRREASSLEHVTHQPAQESAPPPVLNLTEQAVRQVKAILTRENIEDHGLRIAVTSGGCSGYSYGLDFEKQERAGDIVLTLDGLKIYIDAESAQYLNGTVIDYVSGLQESGFKFNNPNVKGTCGCGTSFSA
ncbi:MAG TPA: iron-sulfur cluster assembly accessory protein [Verrucomicrobiae bacterium]|jgi:iron-sulfur cluster assembly accessory protein|nr:iron-sulfur cluster assembly accessory protein [Verrucomicrobiae bacterium]